MGGLDQVARSYRRQLLEASRDDPEMSAYIRNTIPFNVPKSFEPFVESRLSILDTIIRDEGFYSDSEKSPVGAFGRVCKLVTHGVKKPEEAVSLIAFANEAAVTLTDLLESVRSTESEIEDGVSMKMIEVLESQVKPLSEIRFDIETTLQWRVRGLRRVMEHMTLRNSANFQSSRYCPNLTGPVYGAIDVPVKNIFEEVRRHPNAIYSMNHREFEIFVGRILEAHGFEVELTMMGHDDNVDLLCLHSTAYPGKKIALEVKRYGPDNKVSVQLVRQFVGANMQIEADKLVFVTSSSYTPEAIRFASSPNVAKLLVVKGLNDVIEWLNTIPGNNLNL